MERAIRSVIFSVGLGIAIGGVIGYFAKCHYQKWAEESVREVEEYWRKKYEKIDNNYKSTQEEIDKQVAEQICDKMGYLGRSYREKQTCRNIIEKGFKNESKATSHYVHMDPPNHDLVSKMTAITENALAEAEHPMDDGEEFQDGPRIGPDGDIVDEDDEWTSDSHLGAEGDDIKKNHPYIISEWQFSYGRQDYDKVSLEYLCLDDTVLDTDETELDQNFIGPDNLLAFETDDWESIFIRNDILEIDYEIIWTNKSYTHDILGYPEAVVTGRRIWRPWEKD